MILTIEIELENDGMQDGYDAYQAIAQSSIPHHRRGVDSGIIWDANGKIVGDWNVSA